MNVMLNIYALIVSIFFSCQQQNESKENSITKWKECTETLIKHFDKNQAKTPHSFAYMAIANATLYGFNDRSFMECFNKLDSFYQQNKLFGLGYEWDAFGDGTINADTTVYAVTAADHIGIPYLELWQAEIVPTNRITEIIDILLSLPRIKDNEDGSCVAYSNSYNDTCGCVHNVNAGVAYFLQKTLDLGLKYRKAESESLINGIAQREIKSFLPEKKNWFYWDRRQVLSDDSHTGYQVDALMNLSNETKKIALIAGENLFKNRKEGDFNSLNGRIRILRYFPDYSDSMLIEIKHFIENKENSNPRQIAMLAFWSSMFYSYLSKS